MGQSTWRSTRELKRVLVDGIFKRVHFSRERGRSRERESIFRRESVQGRERAEEVCPGYLTSAFRHHPNGCLDQLDPMLALGAALFLHPINKSTCHV